MKTKKSIKVGSLYDSKNSEVPMIRMSGHWLEAIGFRPGCLIEVSGTEQQLILRVIKSPVEVRREEEITKITKAYLTLHLFK